MNRFIPPLKPQVIEILQASYFTYVSYADVVGGELLLLHT